MVVSFHTSRAFCSGLPTFGTASCASLTALGLQVIVLVRLDTLLAAFQTSASLATCSTLHTVSFFIRKCAIWSTGIADCASLAAVAVCSTRITSGFIVDVHLEFLAGLAPFIERASVTAKPAMETVAFLNLHVLLLATVAALSVGTRKAVCATRETSVLERFQVHVIVETGQTLVAQVACLAVLAALQTDPFPEEKVVFALGTRFSRFELETGFSS